MKRFGGLVVLVAMAVAVPTAADGRTALEETGDTWRSCRAPEIVNPFAFAGDDRDYVLAPSGSFEGAANGWTLKKGANVVGGNDPFDLTSGADEKVLSLPPGSVATSPLMCIDLHHPTFRFAARSLASEDGELEVEIIYPDVPKPRWRTVTDLEMDSENGWGLTDDLPLKPEFAGKAPGERRIALRFSVDKDDSGRDRRFRDDDEDDKHGDDDDKKDDDKHGDDDDKKDDDKHGDDDDNSGDDGPGDDDNSGDEPGDDGSGDEDEPSDDGGDDDESDQGSSRGGYEIDDIYVDPRRKN